MFNDEVFVNSLSFGSFSGSFSNGGFGISNELLILSNHMLEFLSLRIESVLKMGCGNTKSYGSISKSNVDFLV